MTETTQPDLALVSWMRRWRNDNPPRDGGPPQTKARAIRSWLDAHGHDGLADSPYTLRVLADAYDSQSPLTVADIPAGQGAASLYIAEDEDGTPVVRCRLVGGSSWTVLECGGRSGDPWLWEHLAATLPTVTEEA